MTQHRCRQSAPPAALHPSPACTNNTQTDRHLCKSLRAAGCSSCCHLWHTPPMLCGANARPLMLQLPLPRKHALTQLLKGAASMLCGRVYVKTLLGRPCRRSLTLLPPQCTTICWQQRVGPVGTRRLDPNTTAYPHSTPNQYYLDHTCSRSPMLPQCSMTIYDQSGCPMRA